MRSFEKVDTAAGDASRPLGEPDSGRWISPAPSRWLLPPSDDPATAVIVHDSVQLAYVAALR